MHLTRVRLHEVSEIEEGLTLLDHQLTFGSSGRPDILAVDSKGALVVMELKADEAGLAALDQGIKYLEWASENLALLARPFSALKPDRSPRLFFVAPEFNESLLRIVKYIELEIVLISAVCVRDTVSSAIGVLFEPVEIPGGVEALPPLRSLEDIVDYIRDPSVKQDLVRILAEIRNLGVNVQPWKGGKDQWIECSFGNKEPVYLQVRQRYFNYYFESDDEDGEAISLRLASYAEWEEKAKEEFLLWCGRAKVTT